VDVSSADEERGGIIAEEVVEAAEVVAVAALVCLEVIAATAGIAAVFGRAAALVCLAVEEGVLGFLKALSLEKNRFASWRFLSMILHGSSSLVKEWAISFR
jgi:hypothetical protein